MLLSSESVFLSEIEDESILLDQNPSTASLALQVLVVSNFRVQCQNDLPTSFQQLLSSQLNEATVVCLAKQPKVHQLV